MIMDGDFLRMNTFANDDERKTAISLLTMAGSPIAITDQHSTIGQTGSFYKNANMLNLHKQGFVGKPYYHNGNPYSSDPTSRDTEKWLGQLPDGSWIVGLFNRSDTKAVRSVDYKADLGLQGAALTTDLWTNQKVGTVGAYKPSLPAHASKVIHIKPTDKKIRYQSEVATWVDGTHFNNNHSGYTGFGFVDGLNKAGAKIVYAIQVPADGQYAITYRYANATGSTSTLQVSATDEKGNLIQQAKRVSFPKTANWSKWSNQTTQVKLKAGVNLITLQRTATDQGAINLDYMELDLSR
ncbi:Isomalto-dextranase precursor [compost metagenome]